MLLLSRTDLETKKNRKISTWYRRNTERVLCQKNNPGLVSFLWSLPEQQLLKSFRPLFQLFRVLQKLFLIHKKILRQKHFQFFINLKLYFYKEQFSNDRVLPKEFASKNHFFTCSLVFWVFILQSRIKKIGCKTAHFRKHSKLSF